MSDTRIKRALNIAFKYGQVDGSHHKMWVIDQMVKELTGNSYEEFVREYMGNFDPKDGTYDYEWDKGIAP